MRIPYQALAPDTLRNLVEEFVTREGTDYGERLYSLDDKVEQVLRQVRQGRVVILYDADSATCHLELRERVPPALLEGDHAGDGTHIDDSTHIDGDTHADDNMTDA